MKNYLSTTHYELIITEMLQVDCSRFDVLLEATHGLPQEGALGITYLPWI